MGTNLDYKDGKIYKVICNLTKNIYIGSTRTTLKLRLQKHKDSYKYWIKKAKNRKYSYTVFEVLKNNNFNIILLELYPCNSKSELIARERIYIESMNCVNKNIPTRTKKEWIDANREKVNEIKNNWRKRNPQYLKQYYLDNKEKLDNKNKQYMEEHKEQQQEYRKQYYQENKESISEKEKEKIECECKRIIRKSDLPAHLKTKIHIDIMNGIEQKPYDKFEKIECECGSIVSKGFISTHKKTDKHKTLMEIKSV